MKEIKRPDIDSAAFKVDTRGAEDSIIILCKLTFRSRFSKRCDSVSITLGLFLIAASRMFERDVLLQFSFRSWSFSRGRVFELLKSFGICLFNFGEASISHQIERDDPQRTTTSNTFPVAGNRRSIPSPRQLKKSPAPESTKNPQETTRETKAPEPADKACARRRKTRTTPNAARKYI
jgi:hypothetical protein